MANDHTAVSRSSFVPIKNLQNVIEAFQIYHMEKMHRQDVIKFARHVIRTNTYDNECLMIWLLVSNMQESCIYLYILARIPDHRIMLMVSYF